MLLFGIFRLSRSLSKRLMNPLPQSLVVIVDIRCPVVQRLIHKLLHCLLCCMIIHVREKSFSQLLSHFLGVVVKTGELLVAFTDRLEIQQNSLVMFSKFKNGLGADESFNKKRSRRSCNDGN
jgi:hypothetical protein